GLDLHGFLEELLRAKELSLPRVDRAEGKVGKERVLRNLNRASQPALSAFQILAFMQQDAVKDRGVEVIGLHFQRALEIVLRAIEIAVVEEDLAEEEAQLVVVTIEAERFFERLDAPVGIERIDRGFGIRQKLTEAIALVSAEQRNDAVLPLHETLFLLEGEHLLAHLRFPQLDQLVGRDDVFLFEDLFRRKQT